MFSGIVGIYFREVNILKMRLWRSFAQALVSPALFLVAFGYGLGHGRVVGGQDYPSFLFAGLLAMATLNTSYAINAEIAIARFHYKIFDEYLIAPVARWQIAIGEMLYGMTKALMPIAIFLVYALIADIDISIGVAFIPVILLHTAFFSLMGFSVALVVRHHADQFAINTFVIAPMTFLSGVFFPVSVAPKAVQVFVQLFPLTHSVALIRATLTGATLPLNHLICFIVFFLAMLATSLLIAKRSAG
ncbi:ABC transporter permease [Deferribacterales bacterium RsTz2092]|nr:transport permease protein [Deferribacterales bacterium]